MGIPAKRGVCHKVLPDGTTLSIQIGRASCRERV